MPRLGGKAFRMKANQEPTYSPGRNGCEAYDTVVVIDCSPSMTEEDWLPSRIAAAREATEHLIDEKGRLFPDDNVGIVVYGGSAKVLHKLAPVRKVRQDLIACLKNIPEIGATNLAAGLRSAADVLANRQTSADGGLLRLIETALLGSQTKANPSRVNHHAHVIVLSDGDSNSGDEVAQAKRLKDDGVVIDCVGIADRRAVDERKLKKVASIGPDGKPRYRFIGDKTALIKEFGRMAGHLRVMGG